MNFSLQFHSSITAVSHRVGSWTLFLPDSTLATLSDEACGPHKVLSAIKEISSGNESVYKCSHNSCLQPSRPRHIHFWEGGIFKTYHLVCTLSAEFLPHIKPWPLMYWGGGGEGKEENMVQWNRICYNALLQGEFYTWLKSGSTVPEWLKVLFSKCKDSSEFWTFQHCLILGNNSS